MVLPDQQVLLWLGAAIAVNVSVSWCFYKMALAEIKSAVDTMEEIRNRHLAAHSKFENHVDAQLSESRKTINSIWQQLASGKNNN